jgi:maleylacetate reductase
VLPHTTAYNAAAAPAAMAAIARALGVADAPRGRFDLARRLGAPAGLGELGLKRTDLNRAADLAVATPYPNPRPVERDAIRALLENAFTGLPPAPPS